MDHVVSRIRNSLADGLSKAADNLKTAPSKHISENCPVDASQKHPYQKIEPTEPEISTEAGSHDAETSHQPRSIMSLSPGPDSVVDGEQYTSFQPDYPQNDDEEGSSIKSDRDYEYDDFEEYPCTLRFSVRELHRLKYMIEEYWPRAEKLKQLQAVDSVLKLRVQREKSERECLEMYKEDYEAMLLDTDNPDQEQILMELSEDIEFYQECLADSEQRLLHEIALVDRLKETKAKVSQDVSSKAQDILELVVKVLRERSDMREKLQNLEYPKKDWNDDDLETM